MLDVTCDACHVTHDKLHMPQDRWREVKLCSRFQLSSFYGLGEMILKIFSQRMTQLRNELMTKVFLKPPNYKGSVRKS